MWRCMDAAGLRWVFCKLYSLFHLDYHSTGAFIQNKESKDDCRRQKGRFYRRKRRKGTNCGGFDACFVFACNFNPSFYFHPFSIAYTLRCLVVERWSIGGGVSWGRKGFATAKGFTPPLSLVIYVTISPHSLAMKKWKKMLFFLRAIMTVKTEAFLTPKNSPPTEFSTLLLSCWLCILL